MYFGQVFGVQIPPETVFGALGYVTYNVGISVNIGFVLGFGDCFHSMVEFDQNKVGPYQIQMELWAPYEWPYKWVAGVISYNPQEWSYFTLHITG